MKQIKNNIILAVVIIVLVIGGLYWSWKQNIIINKQQKKIEELTSKATPNPGVTSNNNDNQISSIDLQTKCNEAANKFFEKYTSQDSQIENAAQNSHWNKLNYKKFNCYP